MLLTKDRPIHEGNQPLTDDILTRVERRYLREVAEAEQKAKEKPKPDDPPTRRTEPTDRGLYADVEVVAAGRDEGTPELSKRLPTYRTIAITGMDGDGKREQAVVRRTSDMPFSLFKSGAITADQMKAARDFRRDFEIGKLVGLYAPDIRRLPGCGSEDLSPSAEAARRRVGDIIKSTGGHGSLLGLVIWWILGDQMSMNDFCARMAFGPSRPLSLKVARKAVIAACEHLEEFYGLED